MKILEQSSGKITTAGMEKENVKDGGDSREG